MSQNIFDPARNNNNPFLNYNRVPNQFLSDASLEALQ